ncbi:hypothetical protein DFH07DRAFT_965374 [Mycena maculata]|uniref:Uncharacterized protein n=1 Tax=Mycena maculata TaxID=230809 RepID=A0AAD7ICS3_9AGAR|nr:hypothetical protein DFH07DRAFT_965374 [Mycena maculata]
MSALKGSSKDRPWIFNAAGRLTLSAPPKRVKAEPKKVPLDIRRGPPSTIIQDPKPCAAVPVAASTSASVGCGDASVAPAKTSIHAAREDASPMVRRPFAARVNGLLDSPEAHPPDGKKVLMRRDLYLGAARPGILETFKGLHECGLCFNLKSHPVSYVTLFSATL